MAPQTPKLVSMAASFQLPHPSPWQSDFSVSVQGGGALLRGSPTAAPLSSRASPGSPAAPPAPPAALPCEQTSTTSAATPAQAAPARVPEQLDGPPACCQLQERQHQFLFLLPPPRRHPRRLPAAACVAGAAGRVPGALRAEGRGAANRPSGRSRRRAWEK